MSFFKRGLSDRLQDELASREEPASLEQLISLVIRLDNRLREREREKSSSSRGTVNSTSSQLPYPLPIPQSCPRPTWIPRTTPALEEPMQVDRTRLTTKERQRRFNQQLCLHCGQPGHHLSTCPALPKGLARQCIGAHW